MYNPFGGNRYKKSRPLSTQDDLHKRGANSQRNLTTAAKLNPNKFWTEHFDISPNQPKQVISLGEEGEPRSIHWKNGNTDKVLISNLDLLDGAVRTENFTKTVLAHIQRFNEQDGLSFPMEIYLDIREKRPSQDNLNDFEGELVRGINELNDTNYGIKPVEIDGGYIKLNFVNRQAEKSISGNVRKNARSLVESDRDSDGKDTSQREEKRSPQDQGDLERPTKRIALNRAKEATVSREKIIDSVQSEKDEDSPKSEIMEEDKDSLQSEKKKQRIPEALDKVEGGLPDQLQRMFKERNVIVAGETHDDHETGQIEKTLHPRFKISVTYEGETIKAPGRDVTPDPPAYRLLYYLEDFYELLHARMKNHDNPDSRQLYDEQMDVLYNRYVKEFDSYSQPAIERSLYYDREALTITYDRLDKFKYILFDTLDLFDKSHGDRSVYNNKLIQVNARGLDKFFDTLKTKSRNSHTEPVMRKLRSIRMYEALQADLADGGKRIYKVGDNHIKDIRDKFGPTAWVIDKAQYKSVLSSF